MGLFRKRAKALPRSTATALSGSPDPLAANVVTPINPAAAVRPARQSGATLGMVGYPPIVTVSKGRKYCEGCKAVLRADVRHVCIHNAHMHLDTLTQAERAQLMTELHALGVQKN